MKMYTLVLTLGLLAFPANAASFLDLDGTPTADIDTSIGMMGLSGNAVDPDEAQRLFFGSGELRVTYPTSNAIELRGDFRWLRTSNSRHENTYNKSLIATGQARVKGNGFTLGAFTGALHTEQALERKNSSRRLFSGLNVEILASANTLIAAEVGYLYRRGGLDGRGRHSLSNAVFWQTSLHHMISKSTRIDVSVGGIAGALDFDKTPPETGRAVTGTLTLHRNLATPGTTAFARFAVSIYDRTDPNRTMAERRLTLGMTKKLGRMEKKSWHTNVTRTAPLAAWVAQSGGPLR